MDFGYYTQSHFILISYRFCLQIYIGVCFKKCTKPIDSEIFEPEWVPATQICE
jgi:hypothetical protein